MHNTAIPIGEPWMWGAFVAFALVMLALDLFVFVFLLIFSSFQVVAEYRRRVLIYGVLGAIVMSVLYFLLADVADRFHLLKYGLAMVLTFIGAKMLIMPWYHMPVAASLTIVAVLIVGSIVASLIATRNGRLPKGDAT